LQPVPTGNKESKGIVIQPYSYEHPPCAAAEGSEGTHNRMLSCDNTK
jgi:hypothetical protein